MWWGWYCVGEQRHAGKSLLWSQWRTQLFIQQAYVLHPSGTRLCEKTGCKCRVGHRACSQRPHQLLAEADKQTKVTPSGRAAIKSSEAPGLLAFEPSKLVEGGGHLEGPACSQYCMLLPLSPIRRDDPPKGQGNPLTHPTIYINSPEEKNRRYPERRIFVGATELPVFYDPSIPLFMRLFIF